jgi:hypothetical protein
LIKLAKDNDRDIRSWSVFGLGSQIESDSPAIREALRGALGDSDHEIRGEALVGLANRCDPAIIADLVNEWSHDFVSILSIEAAEVTRDPRLLTHLNQITEDLTLDDDPHFASKLADAIVACTPNAKRDVLLTPDLRRVPSAMTATTSTRSRSRAPRSGVAGLEVLHYMKLIFNTLLLLTVLGNRGYAQVQELRWGEFGCYSTWERYPYEIESEYEFAGRLPDLREFPQLLEAALDPKMNDSDRKIILSQLRTLSRCDFEKRLEREDSAEVEYRAAVTAWKNWWDTYGSKLPKALAESGRQHEGAWKQIAPTPYLECPKYPILIPPSWSSTLSFRSGDYVGVTEEIIEFLVKDGAFSLKRRYRTGQLGRGEWTHEEWSDFTQEEAEKFVAAVIYSIDNPWFFASDELSERNDKGEDEHFGTILGRPEAWTDYYPSCQWSGFLDAEGRVIGNHEPGFWSSLDYQLGPQTALDDPSVGLVFRIIRDMFPDPSWDPEASRWRRVNAVPDQEGEKAAPSNR